MWLKGVSPAEWRKLPLVVERVEACKADRLAAPDPGRRKLADTQFAHVGQYPHLWSTTIENGTETGGDAKTDAEKMYNGAYATNTPNTTMLYPRRWGGNVRCVKVQNQHN